ncbi:MAG: PAS domain-containing protein [Chthoniobacteraceae bacterium]|nr:PAS domain-containing protein [Chthoniobacteraceae bacterium]
MPPRKTNEKKSSRLSGKSGEALCAALLQETRDAIFLCGVDGRLLLVNPAFAALVTGPKTDITGCVSGDIEPPELGALVAEQNAAVLASGKTRTFEYTTATAGGARTFFVTKGLCADTGGIVRGVFGIARDISESRAVEQEIIDTSDREKQRLGRELRENFCQHLVGISLLGNVLYEELSRAGLEQAEFAQQIAQLVKEVVSQVRTLEKGLSVMYLEQGRGLVEALEDLAEQVRSAGLIECEFHPPPVRKPVEPQTAMYLFRIAQEAVHNALTHFNARRLEIRLAIKPEAMVLSVRDDGEAVPEDPGFSIRSRIGFPIMRYRSRAIGAKLEIKHLRQGEEVVCTVLRKKIRRRESVEKGNAR